MDAITERVRGQSPWTMLFTDDIVLCDKTRERLEGKLERWREELESRGLNISRTKTEYMCCNSQNQLNDIHLLGEIVKTTEEFKYLRLYVEESAELQMEVSSGIKWDGIIAKEYRKGCVIPG
ncbi:uncharacterized protein [Palaemon carinicauda]|uniref:uncharacterized protein n=1 Tax=Palaemon carinicauda TaxID=392227 RepID=UPI0035B5FC0E